MQVHPEPAFEVERRKAQRYVLRSKGSGGRGEDPQPPSKH
jgi:hypothetical protein